MVNSSSRLTRIFYFRLSEADAELLEERVKAAEVSLSEFLRAAALRRKVHAPQVPKVNLTIAGELARIGNNLNQLARHANAGRFSSAVARELVELRQIVKEVQSQVLGVGIRAAGDERAGDE